MRLTDQERGMGYLVATCKCCGNIYKTHQMANSLIFSMTPGFGCGECQGVLPKSNIQMQGKTEWQDMAPPIPKGQPMPQTREYWIQLAARDQELILELKDEISKLKCKVNQLQQKLGE